MGGADSIFELHPPNLVRIHIGGSIKKAEILFLYLKQIMLRPNLEQLHPHLHNPCLSKSDGAIAPLAPLLAMALDKVPFLLAWK